MIPPPQAPDAGLGWITKRFHSHNAPSREDLITVVARVDAAEQLDEVFIAIAQYRQWNIPLNSEFALVLVKACLRVDQAQLARHVLINHSTLRVFPGGDAYTAVITAFLDATDVRSATEVLKVRWKSVLDYRRDFISDFGCERQDGLKAKCASVDTATFEAVLESILDRTSSYDEDGTDPDSEMEPSEADGAPPLAAPEFTRARMRNVEKLLLLAQTAGLKPNLGTVERCAEAIATTGQTYRAERVRSGWS